jgi:hypothetical protein
MLSSKRMVSLLAGMILALPASALANPYNDGHGGYHHRWHDHQWEHGSFDHYHHDDFRTQWPRHLDGGPMIWSGHPFRWNRGPNEGRWLPNRQEPWSWSNGHLVRWWNSRGTPPMSYYNRPQSGSTVGQLHEWLLERRNAAAYESEQLRARHDSRGAGRLATVMQSLNQRLNNAGG